MLDRSIDLVIEREVIFRHQSLIMASKIRAKRKRGKGD